MPEQNPNAAFQNNVVPESPTTTPTQQSTAPGLLPGSMSAVAVQTPQNSIGPGNVPASSGPPTIGSVAGSIPTPQASQTQQAPTISYMANANAAGLPGAPAVQTQPSPTAGQIGQNMQGYFNTVQGTQAPATYPGTQITQGTQPSTGNPMLDSLTASMAPIMNSLNQVISDINNPVITGQSLQEEYNQLSAQYNLPGLNAELLNYQNIMNGTQDDIAAEITGAGGTATQSQILAMTSARNTVIMKQYNALATQYQAAQTNVSNMMQYAGEDQSTALQRESMTASVVESMQSIESQMDTMGLNMFDQAQSNYQWQIQNFGPQQFVASLGGNTSYAEQVLGYAPGTLSNPTFVNSLQTKWQQQLSLTALKQYESLYGTLPPGWTIGSDGAPVYSGSSSSGGATSTSSESVSGAVNGGSTIVGGIDFGTTSSGVKPYATDINSEVEGVSRNYNAILNSYGQNPTSDQLSQYIYQNAPNSPITGQMITSAAQANGVGAPILAALLANESEFGTAGAGATTYNPGNVGNTGASTNNLGSWQAGVNAAAQNLAIRQTGLSADQINSPLYQQALSLANYTASPNQLSKRSTTYGETLAMANTISQNMTGQPYDIGQAQIWYNFAQQPATQNTMNYLSALVGTNNTSGNLQTLMNISGQLGRTNFPAINNAQAWAKLQSGNPQIAAYYTAVTEVSDQVAKILQGGGTGSGTSDAKLQQASSLFDTGFSGPQIQAVASTLQTLLQNRASSIIGNNPYLQAQAQQLGINLGGSVTVTSPDGQVGTIPQSQLQQAVAAGYKVQS